MINAIGIILQVQQNWIHPTSNLESSSVLQQYNELVTNVVNSILLDKEPNASYIQLTTLLDTNLAGSDLFNNHRDLDHLKKSEKT